MPGDKRDRRTLPVVQSDADRALRARRTPPLGTPALDGVVAAPASDEVTDVRTIKQRIIERLQDDPSIADMLDAVVEELMATVRKASARAANHDMEILNARGGIDCCEDVAELKTWRVGVDKLHVSLLGHQESKDPGRLARMEDRLENHDTVISRLDRIAWKVIAAATVGGGAVIFALKAFGYVH